MKKNKTRSEFVHSFQIASHTALSLLDAGHAGHAGLAGRALRQVRRHNINVFRRSCSTLDSRVLIVAARRRSVSSVTAIFERALASRALDAIEPDDAGSDVVASRLTIGSFGSETVSQLTTHDIGIGFIPQAAAHRSPYAAMEDFDSSFVASVSSDKANR